MISKNDALLILNAIPALSNKTVQKLIEWFGSAQEALKRNQKQLEETGIVKKKSVQNIIDFQKEHFLENEKKLIEQYGVSLLAYDDPDYPQQLAAISDAPVILYTRGSLPKNHNISLAIVGSRKASVYGINTAESFGVKFGELGIPVVSGMARGVDTAAHRGVLKAKGSTIAVLGSGLAYIYPPENKFLYKNITETGSVISEFPMQSSPLPYNFPRRNRIISGLSMGVIVVEAAEKSGALITADFALEQGRDVFAIPGRIDSLSAAGTHKMIKQGAKLVTGIEDILEEYEERLQNYLSMDYPLEEQTPTAVGEDIAGPEREVLLRINKSRPVHIDEITEQCEGKVSNVFSTLVQLEMKKYIKQLPGKYFVR